MNLYDKGTGHTGSKGHTLWRAFWRLVFYWLHRERQLIMLRNTIGMLAEARRADAREYEDMEAALRDLRQQLRSVGALPSVYSANQNSRTVMIVFDRDITPREAGVLLTHLRLMRSKFS